MRYLPIKKVEAGMVLAQDILDGQGVMLLGRHQILNQEQIENLDKMGYPGLYIDDKFSEEIEIAEVIKPSIHSKSLEIVHHLFIDRMEEEDVSEQEWQIREAVMQVVDSLLENVVLPEEEGPAIMINFRLRSAAIRLAISAIFRSCRAS